MAFRMKIRDSYYRETVEENDYPTLQEAQREGKKLLAGWGGKENGYKLVIEEVK